MCEAFQPFRPLKSEELKRPMSGPVVSENQRLSIYLWANSKPASFQAGLSQPASVGLPKPGDTPRQVEGRNRPLHPPPMSMPGKGHGQGGPRPCRKVFFSVSHSKKKLDLFRASA